MVTRAGRPSLRKGISLWSTYRPSSQFALSTTVIARVARVAFCPGWMSTLRTVPSKGATMRVFSRLLRARSTWARPIETWYSRSANRPLREKLSSSSFCWLYWDRARWYSFSALSSSALDTPPAARSSA